MYRPHGKAVLTISVKKLFKNVEKPLDKSTEMCYNNNRQGGEVELLSKNGRVFYQARCDYDFSKIFEKPLDKHTKV